LIWSAVSARRGRIFATRRANSISPSTLSGEINHRDGATVSKRTHRSRWKSARLLELDKAAAVWRSAGFVAERFLGRAARNASRHRRQIIDLVEQPLLQVVVA
jgi:hypothetical protein